MTNSRKNNNKNDPSSKNPMCHLRWTNVIKTVELKDNGAGLIKSTLGGGGDKTDKAPNGLSIITKE
jgi:hypothetical protein